MACKNKSNHFFPNNSVLKIEEEKRREEKRREEKRREERRGEERRGEEKIGRASCRERV